MKDHPDADHVKLKTIGKTLKCAKYQDSQKELPKGLPLNSRGAMLQIFQQHLYSKKVEQPDFDENKVYLCANHEGNDYLLDPGNDNDKPFFVAVFSTEELLLNLARQHQSGQDIHVMMDHHIGSLLRENVGTFQLKLALSPKQAALWHML
jgi:hypothetical protein